MWLRGALIGTALLLSIPAYATTIDFESYSDPSVLGTSFSNSGATFSITSGTGFEVSAYGIPDWGTAAPQILCPRADGINRYCSGDFDVNFSTAVTNLKFYFTGDEDTRLSLSVEAFFNGSSLGVQTFAPDGDVFTAQLVDLSGLGSIDRISVNEPGDPDGYGYDDFSFDRTGSRVPEPGTLSLLSAGLVALAVRRRRRAKTL